MTTNRIDNHFNGVSTSRVHDSVVGGHTDRSTSRLRSVFSFPETVDEHAARSVATGVVVMCAAMLITGWQWLLIPLAYGFWARVLTGPTLSPLAQVVTRVAVPRLGLPDRPTAGTPKRFAQGIGATLSSAAVVAWLIGIPVATDVFVVMILAAATLEAAFGFCLGCAIFGQLTRWGVVSDRACPECADITARLLERTGGAGDARGDLTDVDVTTP